jgi:hypothetical protein
MAQRVERQRQPLREYDNEDLPLYVRYINQPWVLFDANNKTIQHQKKGLEMFIASGKESLDVSIPHYNGGQFMVEYGKNINTNEETNKEMIHYFYIKTNLETVQMMYAEPEYIAYINRLTAE